MMAASCILLLGHVSNAKPVMTLIIVKIVSIPKRFIDIASTE